MRAHTCVLTHTQTRTHTRTHARAYKSRHTFPSAAPPLSPLRHPRANPPAHTPPPLLQFLDYLDASERTLEPVFGEQTAKLGELQEAFQFLHEETRRAFTASGDTRLPLVVSEPLNNVRDRRG